MNNSLRTETAKAVTFEAVITRADGTIENLGVVAYYDKNPIKVWTWKVQRLWKRMFKGWELTSVGR